MTQKPALAVGYGAEISGSTTKPGLSIHSRAFTSSSCRNQTVLRGVQLDVLIAAPDQRTARGRRDRTLLLFLGTGARCPRRWP